MTRLEFIAKLLELDLDASKYAAMTDAEYESERAFLDEKARKLNSDAPRRFLPLHNFGVRSK